MPKNIAQSNHAGKTAAETVATAVMDFLSDVPRTRLNESTTPETTAKMAASRAARKAATTAGALALPPGAIGWITILPEMVAVWRLQSQLVSDIAAIYGKTPTLTKEQMVYCLFRHTVVHAVGDLVVRVGERVLVRRASLQLMQAIAQKVGVRITQRAIGKGVSRWIPLVGAVGVGGYAYYDTKRVAKTAIDLFSRPIELEGDESDA